MRKQEGDFRFRSAFLIALVLTGMFTVVSGAFAQSATSGAVVGTVTDATGAVVPNAEVQLVNVDTNASQTQTTNATGGFVFPSVAPGNYRVSVKMKGFRTATVSSLAVEVNKSLTVPMQLEVGGDTEIVEVTATAAAQLQTNDAQIGNTVSTDAILRLPTLQRNATELMGLQPATSTVGNNIMMRVGGALDDQNTVTVDGIDITQNIVAAGVSVPTPADSIEEFRGGVTNPNANFDRASGSSIALIGRHGSNVLHGALYEYLQNSDLNSNTWDNNLIGVPKAVIHDNRYGARLGGPIMKNKTFLFGNFEERRFQSAGQVQRTVPTQSLRDGILQFRDLNGNVQQFNLKTATVCGASGNQACDPRSLGVSPSVAAQWAKEPLPNVPGGDGLNTGGFFGVLPTPIRDDYGVARLDHVFAEKLQFNGSYTYYRHIATSSAQISIVDGNLQSVRQPPNRGSVTAGSLTYQVKPSLLNTFRFGYVHDTDDTGATSPTKAAGILNIPGTASSAGPIAMLVGGGVSTFLDSPIDMDTQRSRYQADYAGYWQYLDDMSWIHGKHTVNFGVQFNKIPYTHVRADKVVGSLSSLAVLVDGDQSFLHVTSANQPQTCSASITSNCIRATDLKNWDRFYASALGLVDNVGILTARDANLIPLPFGTNLRNQTNQYATYFYGQDSWRIAPSLTLTFGLAYGWQTSPTEVNNLQTLQIDATSGAFISGPQYIAAKQAAALQGQTYNPLLGYQPVGNAHRGVVSVDYGDVAPRVSIAWNPSASSGFLGSLLGNKKTVIRGGYALVYDRTNTVQTVLIPMLGVGFGQTITVQGPRCNATGAGGAGCSAAAGTGNVGLSAFRVGVDGTLPLPTVPAVSVPVIPPVGQYSETLSFQDDPNNKVGRSTNVDLSIQRELPGNMILETAYIGRMGRRLPQAVSLSNAPYMLVDKASGQSFAQAFDAAAKALRGGATAATIGTQPWFENQLPGINPGGTATSFLASNAKASFTTGDVSTLFFLLDNFRRSLKLPTYNNDQVLDLFMRTYIGQSNYNAGILTLTKRMSHGLTVSGNYTISKALDDNILNQNQAFFFSNSYHPGVDYGPSRYDVRHAFNAYYYYEIPAGQGHRFGGGKIVNQILGGWYASGIVTARTGLPLIVTQSTNSFGADVAGFAQNTAAIPTASVSGSSTSRYNSSCTAEGANAAKPGGSGMNIFSDPCAAFNSFRYMNISSDTRSGKGNPFYGQPFWNFDMSFGKSTRITEKVNLRFSGDMFNIFNHHDYNDPSSLSLQNPNAFGVITSSFVPANRTNSARWIEFGMRLEF